MQLKGQVRGPGSIVFLITRPAAFSAVFSPVSYKTKRFVAIQPEREVVCASRDVAHPVSNATWLEMK